MLVLLSSQLKRREPQADPTGTVAYIPALCSRLPAKVRSCRCHERDHCIKRLRLSSSHITVSNHSLNTGPDSGIQTQVAVEILYNALLWTQVAVA